MWTSPSLAAKFDVAPSDALTPDVFTQTVEELV